MKIKEMNGYKAFNKDMKCIDFQFKEGETYEEKEAVCCKSGFHFCTDILDVLNYYPLTNSKFHHVKALGKISKGTDSDSRFSTTKIKIGKEIKLAEFVELATESKQKGNKTNSVDYPQLASSEDYSKLVSSEEFTQLVSSGDCSQLASSGCASKLAISGRSTQLVSSGDCSQLASSGCASKLAINGNNSVGANVGICGRIKGKKGNWIVLAEYSGHVPIYVKAAKIDGKKLKEDTWYKLKNKKFMEVDL